MDKAKRCVNALVITTVFLFLLLLCLKDEGENFKLNPQTGNVDYTKQTSITCESFVNTDTLIRLFPLK